MNVLSIIGHSVIRLDVVDSTNNYAAMLINETNVVNGTTILAKNQTNGRGQKGNNWYVEPNSNLTFSFILNQISVKVDEQFQISKWIAVSLVQFLKQDYNVDCVIKWPNDILIRNSNKKIAGILIENSIRGSKINTSVIGIGLNVNQIEFPAGIKASSIKNEMHIDQNLDLVFSNCLKILNANYVSCFRNISKLDKDYYSLLLGYNTLLQYEDSEGLFYAKIKEVEPTGKLVLLDENKEEKKYAFKEVKFIL